MLNGLEGEEVKTLCETLVGNTAIMYTHTNTPAAPARIIKKLQRDGFTKPVVKGAYVQDCVFIGEDKLDQLAAIKTREELIGDIIGLLQSPARNLVSALQNAAEGKADDEKIYTASAAASEPAPAAEAAPEVAAEPAAEAAAAPAEETKE